MPEALAPASELFKSTGYAVEALLTNYVLDDVGPNFSSATAQSEENNAGRFVIPVTVDDLAANSLLGEADSQVCWERSVETLTARKADIAGLAVASDERIEAYVLCVKDEIVSLRTFIEDGGVRLQQLLARLSAQGMRAFRLPKVHPSEISKELLETLGFRPAGVHRLYAAKARSD